MSTNANTGLPETTPTAPSAQHATDGPTLPLIDADDLAALETDSAFGDNVSVASSKTSLASSVAKYRIEHGRTYHGFKDGTYLVVSPPSLL